MIRVVSAFRLIFESGGVQHPVGSPFFDREKAESAAEEFARVNRCDPNRCFPVRCYLLEVLQTRGKSLYFNLGNAIDVVGDPSDPQTDQRANTSAVTPPPKSESAPVASNT